jgi:hypothetical protein
VRAEAEPVVLELPLPDLIFTMLFLAADFLPARPASPRWAGGT